MSTVIATSVLPDSTANDTLTIGATGDSVAISNNLLTMNTLQDAGGNNIFVSNGSGTITSTGLPGAMTLISSQTASNTANISFTTGIDSTYDVYLFKYYNWQPVTDGTDCTFNASIDGGSSYASVLKTTTIFRAYHGENDTSGLDYEANEDIQNGTGYQNLSFYCGADADECSAGELYLFGPSSTTYAKQFYATTQMIQGGEGVDSSQNIFCAGYLNTTSAINAIDFKQSAGNINVGIFKLYGISKS